MANFTATKLNSANVNKNTQYIVGDGLQPDAVNAIVQGIMYNSERVLPTVSSSNEGAFLRVDSSGNWVAEQIPFAEGVEF